MINATTHINQIPLSQRIDWPLMCLWLALMSIGLIMVASASVSFAALTYNDAWFFAKRHAIYMLLGVLLAMFVVCVPMSVWQRYSGHFLLLTFFLLVIVLIPGIGKDVAAVSGVERKQKLGEE